jgi:hypothetical protein
MAAAAGDYDKLNAVQQALFGKVGLGALTGAERQQVLDVLAKDAKAAEPALAAAAVGDSWEAPGWQADGAAHTKRVTSSEQRGDGTTVYHVQIDGQRTADILTAEQVAQQRRIDTENLKQRRESKAAADEKDRQAAEAQAGREDLDGFDADMTPMQRGRVRDALTRMMNYRGKAMSRRDIIRALVADGAQIVDWAGTPALERPDESGLDQKALTKTGIDYARHLLAKAVEPAPAAEAPAPDPATRAPGESDVAFVVRNLKRVDIGQVGFSLIRKFAYYSIFRPLGIGFPIKGEAFDRDEKRANGADASRILVTAEPVPIVQLAQLELAPATPSAKLAALKEAYAATPGTQPGRYEFRDPAGQGDGRGASITKSAKSAGFQLSMFDGNGFSGDMQFDTMDDALTSAMSSGFIEPAPGHLADMAQLESFQEGNARTLAMEKGPAPRAAAPTPDPEPAAVVTTPFKLDKETGEWAGEVDGVPIRIYRDTAQFGTPMWHISHDDLPKIGRSNQSPGLPTRLGSTKVEAIETVRRELVRPDPVAEAPVAEEPVTPEPAPATDARPSIDTLKSYAAKVVKGDGVSRVWLVGSSAVEGSTPNDTDILYEMDAEPTVEGVEEAIEQSQIDLDAYDTFIKAGDRYFVVKSGAGREVVENTEYAAEEQGKPRVLLAEAPRAAGAPEPAPESDDPVQRAKDRAVADGGLAVVPANEILDDINENPTGEDWKAARDRTLRDMDGLISFAESWTQERDANLPSEDRAGNYNPRNYPGGMAGVRAAVEANNAKRDEMLIPVFISYTLRTASGRTTKMRIPLDPVKLAGIKKNLSASRNYIFESKGDATPGSKDALRESYQELDEQGNVTKTVDLPTPGARRVNSGQVLNLSAREKFEQRPFDYQAADGTRYVYTEDAAARAPEIEAAVQEAIGQVNPNGEVRVVSQIYDGTGKPVLGASTDLGDGRLVVAALSYVDPATGKTLANPNLQGTLRHETVHDLRARGMFTPQEDKLLFRSARNRRIRDDLDIAKDYGDKPDAVQAEEAIARAAEIPGKYASDPKLNSLLDRIRRFFQRLGNKLRGMGFQTFEDVFDKFESGEIGRRPDNSFPSQSSAFTTTQTRTTGFKNWFRGSKVVDENGEPLVVYHGAPIRFADAPKILQDAEKAEARPYPRGHRRCRSQGRRHPRCAR